MKITRRQLRRLVESMLREEQEDEKSANGEGRKKAPRSDQGDQAAPEQVKKKKKPASKPYWKKEGISTNSLQGPDRLQFLLKNMKSTINDKAMDFKASGPEAPAPIDAKQSEVKVTGKVKYFGRTNNPYYTHPNDREQFGKGYDPDKGQGFAPGPLYAAAHDHEDSNGHEEGLFVEEDAIESIGKVRRVLNGKNYYGFTYGCTYNGKQGYFVGLFDDTKEEIELYLAAGGSIA